MSILTLDNAESAESLAARVGLLGNIFHVVVAADVVCLTPVEHRLLVACRDGRVVVVDLRPLWNGGAPGTIRDGPTLQHGMATCMAAELSLTCPPLRCVASLYYGVGGSDVFIAEVDLESGSLEEGDKILAVSRMSARSRGEVTAIACTKGNVYTAARDRCIRLFDVRDGTMTCVLEEDVCPPTSLSLLPDQRLLLTCSDEGAGSVSVWRLPLLMMRGGGKSDKAWTRQWCGLALAQRGASTAEAVAADATRQLDCLHTFAMAGTEVHSAHLATGGCAALCASHTGELQVLDLERRRVVAGWTSALFGHSRPLQALALVGDAVITASNGCELHITRCTGAPGATGSSTNASVKASSVEDVLRGIEEAADELGTPR